MQQHTDNRLFPGLTAVKLSSLQAAEVDLSSVRETAVMGLQRLEAVDQDFSPFQVCSFVSVYARTENEVRSFQDAT